jgi:hypothetical protein
MPRTGVNIAENMVLVEDPFILSGHKNMNPVIAQAEAGGAAMMTMNTEQSGMTSMAIAAMGTTMMRETDEKNIAVESTATKKSGGWLMPLARFLCSRSQSSTRKVVVI